MPKHWSYCSLTLSPRNVFIVLGIGYETAKRLSYMGAKVIMACRDEAKAQKVCNLDTAIKLSWTQIVYYYSGAAWV